MARVEPPRALTKEEFDNRVKAGAKTIVEIDPALAKWCTEGYSSILPARKKILRILGS